MSFNTWVTSKYVFVQMAKEDPRRRRSGTCREISGYNRVDLTSQANDRRIVLLGDSFVYFLRVSFYFWQTWCLSVGLYCFHGIAAPSKVLKLPYKISLLANDTLCPLRKAKHETQNISLKSTRALCDMGLTNSSFIPSNPPLSQTLFMHI